MKAFQHLCFGERKKIERWLRKSKSITGIAQALGRAKSSISDEINSNSVRGVYNAKKAQHKADVKREKSKRDCLKVSKNPELQKFVIQSIKEDQSPEGISGRLKYIETEIEYASTKAIYKFVDSPHGRQIEGHLYSNAVKKKTGPKRGTSVGIDGRTFIDERPKKVEKRLEFGHYEGDFIESGRDGVGSLLVVVERKTRYPFLAYLTDRSTANVNRVINQLIGDKNPQSLTIDNDISFQKHPELSELLDSVIYFCHPQSPNEKGTVENRNKAIRRYVPKRSDLSSFDEQHFKMVETKLRNKFMTCLQFKTPKECYEFEMRVQKSTRVRDMMKSILVTS